MATHKKYHDLVILDESNESNTIDIRKLIFGGLLFASGIAVGSIIVSSFNARNDLVQNPTISPLGTITTDTPVPIISITGNGSSDLQSITAEDTESSAGCGIESLGLEENPEGCSADAFTEVPSDTTEAGFTDLNHLISPEDKMDEPAPITGSTNILDLK